MKLNIINIRFYFYILIAVSVIGGLTGCNSTPPSSINKNKEGAVNQLKNAKKSYVSPKAVFSEIQEGKDWVVLDVRTPQEYSVGHIPDASPVNIRQEDFKSQIDLLDKKKDIFIYCNTGVGRSDSAFNILEAEGFKNLHIIKGGLLAWEDEGLPTKQDTSAIDIGAEAMKLSVFDSLVKNTKQLLLIDFHTLWCANCLKIAPYVDAIKEAYKGKVIVKRINIATSREIRKAHHITGIPVLKIYKRGEVVWKHKGYIPKEAIEDALNVALSS